MTIGIVVVDCFRRLYRLVPHGEHDIDLELYELGREILEPGRLSACRSVLERDVTRIADEGLLDELLILRRGPARVQPTHPDTFSGALALRLTPGPSRGCLTGPKPPS